MHTEVLPADPASIARAAEVLRGGGLVAFPTETVYGLGAHALEAAAVGRIFTAKGRPPTNPLIVHVGEPGHVAGVAAAWPDHADALARCFWPGPLTLVLRKRQEVPAIVTANGPTVAVRMPAHPVALALLHAAAVPIAAPSANRSGQLSPTSAEHVLRSLGGLIDLILDGGPTPGGIESTVLDLTTSPPRLLRPGLLPVADLEAIIGPVQRSGDPVATVPLSSPGMLQRHYAPRTPLVCVERGDQRVLETLVRDGLRIGWLTFGPVATSTPAAVVVRSLSGDPASAAAQLYAVLHELDDANLDRILVALPPDTDAWVAIRDRLRRASA